MADILIKGMEMPKNNESIKVFIITSEGVFRMVDEGEGKKLDAVEVKPHGRLIDENDLVRLIEDNYGCGVCKNKADEERCLDRCKWAVLLNDIDSLPTVLEASNGTGS